VKKIIEAYLLLLNHYWSIH